LTRIAKIAESRQKLQYLCQTYINFMNLLKATLFILSSSLLSFLNATAQRPQAVVQETKVDQLSYVSEKYFENMRQLTFGGDNAEAYWSFDSKQLIFQSNNPAWGVECDQIFILSDLEQPAKQPPMVSDGRGRTTCAYFLAGDSLILYASTHAQQEQCPPPPAPRDDRKYLWPIDPAYDIYIATTDGKIVKTLADSEGYDAEATVSPNGRYVVFTSTRTGDLELFVYDLIEETTTQITNTLGYDGGAFFSPDSKQILFRASRPQSPEEIEEYSNLLAEGLVAPTDMELFICDLDGSNLRQITKLGRANWAPFFHPDGKRIVFSSNHHSPRGFPFNLFMINVDGTGLEQISFDNTFDSFPMFSPDGKRLSFSSNRFNGGNRDTNVFVVDWIED